MWRISKERIINKIRSMISPTSQQYFDLESQLKTFQDDLNTRVNQLNELSASAQDTVQQFRRVMSQNNESIDLIMKHFDTDVPTFQEQAEHEGWKAGLFDLPYGKENRLFFNPSIVEYDKQRWLIVRNCQFNPHKKPPYDSFSALDRYQLDGTDIIPDSGTRIPLPLGKSKREQWEDPRILDTGSKLVLSCTNFIQGLGHAHIALAIMDKSWNIQGINHPKYGHNGHDLPSNTEHEKNWTWFMHEGEMHMVYDMEPHTVVRCDSAASPQEEYQTDLPSDMWRHGRRRGGSNPVRIGDEYFAFYHSSLPWWRGRRRYYMGAYAFEAKPPFRITRSTSLPLLTGSKNNHRVLEFPLVIFPGGSLYNAKQQEHMVVFGVNDYQSGWTKISHEDLLERMKIYVRIKKKTPSKVTAETTNRLHPIPRLEKIAGADISDKTIIPDYGDAGYPGAAEKRNAKANNAAPAKRKRRRTTKAGKS